MKKAVARAMQQTPKTQDYTALYRDIYDTLKTSGGTHEELHRTAISVTHALWRHQLRAD